MPKPAAETEERFDEVSLPEETLRRGIPVIRARVVYLGADKNKSMTMPGQLDVQLVESEDGTAVRDNGHYLARSIYKKEYIDLVPDEKADVDRQKVTRRYKEVKKASKSGMSTYEFPRYDAGGALIRENLVPDTAPAHLRGRPFKIIEHAGHIARFFAMQEGPNKEKEFEITVRSQDQEALSDYIRRSRRGMAAEVAEVNETMTGNRY